MTPGKERTCAAAPCHELAHLQTQHDGGVKGRGGEGACWGSPGGGGVVPRGPWAEFQLAVLVPVPGSGEGSVWWMQDRIFCFRVETDWQGASGGAVQGRHEAMWVNLNQMRSVSSTDDARGVGSADTHTREGCRVFQGCPVHSESSLPLCPGILARLLSSQNT